MAGALPGAGCAAQSALQVYVMLSMAQVCCSFTHEQPRSGSAASFVRCEMCMHA